MYKPTRCRARARTTSSQHLGAPIFRCRVMPHSRPDLLAGRCGRRYWPAPPVRDHLPEGASPPASLKRFFDAPWQRLCPRKSLGCCPGQHPSNATACPGGMSPPASLKRNFCAPLHCQAPCCEVARPVLFRNILSCIEGVSLRQKDRNRKRKQTQNAVRERPVWS